MVEAPGLRPVLERPRGAHLAPRRHMPLAEAARDVAVLLEDPGQGRAASRPRPRVARERTGELRDPAHAHAVVVASGEKRRAGRRADGGHVEAVVGQTHLLDARQGRRPQLAAERLGTTEAGVVHEHDQDVRGPIRRLGPGDHRPVADGRVHRPADHAPEVPVRDRQHGPILAELAHRLGEGILQGGRARLLRLDNGAHERPGQDLLDGEGLVLLEHRKDGGGAGLERLADLVVEARLHLVLREAPGDSARRGPNDGGCEQRGSGKTHEEADRAAVAEPLAAEVVAGLLDDDVVVLVVADEDRALDADLLRLHRGDEVVEFLRGGVDARVPRNQDVGQLVSHEVVSRQRCPAQPAAQDGS